MNKSNQADIYQKRQHFTGIHCFIAVAFKPKVSIRLLINITKMDKSNDWDIDLVTIVCGCGIVNVLSKRWCSSNVFALPVFLQKLYEYSSIEVTYVSVLKISSASIQLCVKLGALTHYARSRKTTHTVIRIFRFEQWCLLFCVFWVLCGWVERSH